MQTKRIPYTFNRGGYYYFTRRVPTDLQKHYLSPRIVQGLNTTCASTARVRANMAAAKLDEYWSHLRLSDPKLIGHHLLKASNPKSSAVTRDDVSTVSLSDALEMYLCIKGKGKGKGKTFHAAAERACRYLVEASGSKSLDEYTRKDALAYRDYLIAKGLAGSSVNRIFNSLVSVFNFVISEEALEIKNPFSRMYFDRTDKVKRRLPVPLDALRLIQAKCRVYDDDMRWLVSLLSDTGMRLSEAAGLHVDDLVLDHSVPHVFIQQHAWRTLKTVSSERRVPLIGEALWSAQRIRASRQNDCFAFPRYNKQTVTNGNSASAALNKWLKQYLPNSCSVHSFRHSLRDRLRTAKCPSEMIDQLGGWTRGAVGQGYGEGYQLTDMQAYMINIKLS